VPPGAPDENGGVASRGGTPGGSQPPAWHVHAGPGWTEVHVALGVDVAGGDGDGAGPEEGAVTPGGNQPPL
jgi:hypothetical protein